MHTFPYLLNMVAINYTTLEFQVIARGLMSKLNTKAYKAAFDGYFFLLFISIQDLAMAP